MLNFKILEYQNKTENFDNELREIGLALGNYKQ